MSTDTRIPVYIVSGFLGAGKTTFLRKALREPAFAGSLLLVNEVGEFGVDDRLMRLEGAPAMLLGNGCLCCTANEGLAEALHKIVETDFGQGVARVIVETTGLADPLPVISTIAIDAYLAASLRVELVLTLVDALHAGEAESASGDYMRQVQTADVVLLSKTDIATPAQVESARAMAIALNPLCRCLDAQTVELHELLGLRHSQRADRLAGGWFTGLEEGAVGPSRTRLRLGSRTTGAANHSLRVKSFCLELGDELDWMRFSVWLSLLLHRHGDAILRIKGFLALEDHAAPIVLNCVHHVTYFPEHLPDWPDEIRKSFLVFVVRDLSPDLVLRSLLACVRPAARVAAPSHPLPPTSLHATATANATASR